VAFPPFVRQNSKKTFERRVEKLKFRLKKGKGSVQHFTDAQGKNYLPGDVIDLPQSYLGEKWLEPVEALPKVIVPPAKVEPVAAAKVAETEVDIAPKKSRMPKA